MPKIPFPQFVAIQLLTIIALLLLAIAAKAEDPVFEQSFKYSSSFTGRRVIPAKKDPIVRMMITKADKTAVGAKIQSGEWLEIGDSAFSSNGSKPQIDDAIAMGRRLGADILFYQVTSNGIQTVKQVFVSPQYVEGESGYYNNTTNLPGKAVARFFDLKGTNLKSHEVLEV
jgi:hypothetical protein